MATLTGNSVASTYKQLLKVTSEGIGADASAKYIEDGLGTDSALSISTTRVGIGTTAPEAPLHIQTSDPSAATPSTNADELWIENNGNAGITISNPDANQGSLFFGNATSNIVAQVGFEGTTMHIGTNKASGQIKLKAGELELLLILRHHYTLIMQLNF